MSTVQRPIGIVILSCAVLTGQFRAGIQGVVKDATGGVVPGARITLSNNETKRIQKTQTSNQGFYSFSNLFPGNYTIAVEKQGFPASGSNHGDPRRRVAGPEFHIGNR
jgi:hypothetical protein